VKLLFINSDGAVLGFFVLSGFYMAMVLETHYYRNLKAFYFNRFLRLYPSYLVCLLLTIILFCSLKAVFHQAYGPMVAMDHAPLSLPAEIWFAATQITMWGQDINTYVAVGAHGQLIPCLRSTRLGESLSNYSFVPQAWTLSIELSFYALAPWLVRWRTWILTVLFFGGLALRVAALGTLDSEATVWFGRFLPLELTVFFGGILAWRVVGGIGSAIRTNLGVTTAVGTVIVIFLGWLWSARAGQCLTAPLLVCLVLPWLWLNVANERLDRFLGDLSYPLYVSHIMVCYLLLACLPAAQMALLPIYAIIGSLFMALVLHYGVEVPLGRFKLTSYKGNRHGR